MRTAIIVGISGIGGRSLIDTLLNNKFYKKVTIFTRRDAKRLKNIHLKKVLVDFSQIENYKSEFEGIDDVFCLMGTDFIITQDIEDAAAFDFQYPLAFAKVAKDSGVKNFYLLNNSSASINSTKHKEILRAKLEKEITDLGFENLVIFKVNKIGKSVNERSTLYLTSRGFSKVINLVGFGLINKVSNTPANVLARKMVEVAMGGEKGQTVFHPGDY